MTPRNRDGRTGVGSGRPRVSSDQRDAGKVAQILPDVEAPELEPDTVAVLLVLHPSCVAVHGIRADGSRYVAGYYSNYSTRGGVS